MNKPGRPHSGRKPKKGPAKGSGGQGRKALEGKGPTPKAEDRTYHVAAKRKAARENAAARGPAAAARERSSKAANPRSRGPRPARGRSESGEMVTGRNAVVEALAAKIPATTLYVATGIDADDRTRKSISFANNAGIAILDVTRPELDRLTGPDVIHQGIALAIPPYEYARPLDLFDNVHRQGQVPLLVALDGVTDPRNLGAIVRSTAAFGGHGLIIPQRRSAALTASAWKASAGAAARIPVAMAPNLTQTLKALKQQGAFIVGLDADGPTPLDALELAALPLVLVVGSEGKGLSRLVSQHCDTLVSIPISSATESLNAGIAASITLYDIARKRMRP